MSTLEAFIVFTSITINLAFFIYYLGDKVRTFFGKHADNPKYIYWIERIGKYYSVVRKTPNDTVIKIIRG